MKKNFLYIGLSCFLAMNLFLGCNKNLDSKANIYYLDPNQEKILSQQININTKKNKSKINDVDIKSDQEKILLELKKNNVLDQSAKINNLSIEDQKNDDGIKNKVLFIDFNSGFIDLSKLGSESEDLVLRAISKTFGEFYGAKKVKLTVDGQNYESGHIELGSEDYFDVEQ